MTDGAADRAASGDLAAFTELVARHQAMAFGYALAILRDVDSAQDATQEAFVAAYFALGSLADGDKFPQWLRGIVRHQCWRLLRRRELATAPLDSANALHAPGVTPEQWCVEQEATERIIAALAGLPAHIRPIATLYYLQDRSQREIATILNLPKTTVNNRLHAARLLLRDRRDIMRGGHTTPLSPAGDTPGHPGALVRVRGNLIEARFPADARPKVLTALAIEPGGAAAIAVIQTSADGLTRGVSLGETPLTANSRLIDLGRPIDRSISSDAVRALIADTQHEQGDNAPIETGIKALDLLYPIGRRGTLGIFGDMGVGKVVVLAELIRNTVEREAGFDIFVFVQAGEESPFLHSLDDELIPTAATDRVSYLVVDQQTILQSGGAAALDTVIYLTREQAQRGFYPAIDFARSTSTLLDPAIVGAEHYRVAQEVLDLLTRFPEESAGDNAPSARARRLRRFLSQAFFVAEPYTNVPGEFVPLAATLAGCTAILRGDYDQVDERAFIRIGAVEQAHNRAATF